MKIINWFLCHIMGAHKWTCKAEKGILPKENESVKSYTEMYCDNCGKLSKLNSRINF